MRLKHLYEDDKDEKDEDVKVAHVFCKYLEAVGMFVPVGKSLPKIRLILVLAYFQLASSGMIGYSLYYLKNNPFDLEYMADPLAGALSSTLSTLMQVCFLFPANRLNQLLEDLRDFTDHEMPNGYIETLRKINKMAKRFILAIVVVLIACWSVLFFERCEDDVVEVCGLLVSAYFPFVNIYRSPAREIYMTLQTGSAYVNGTTSCILLGVYASISKCLVMHIEHLQKMFLEIPRLATSRDRKAQIKKCVLYHYLVIDYRNRAAKNAIDVFFYLLFFASITISLTSYQCIAFPLKIQVALHLVVYLLFSIINCYFGEDLITASDSLLFTIYESMPLDDYRTSRDLCFILLCSSKGISMPAGKIATVGFMKMKDMLSKSYSYLTMLLNMQ